MRVKLAIFLSWQDLIREKKRDLEILSLNKYAVSEKETVVEPSCYFWKEGVLMWKWRSPVVLASQEWKVLY